jgi:hypothetical protein
MIAATVTLSMTSTSLYDLINTATPGQLNNFVTGRVAEVHIQWVSGTFHLVYKSGTTDAGAPGGPTINVATDSGRIFSDPATGTPVTGQLAIEGATGVNVISLKDIYLVVPNAGAGSARVLAYTI